jgi:hypothetical protein
MANASLVQLQKINGKFSNRKINLINVGVYSANDNCKTTEVFLPLLRIKLDQFIEDYTITDEEGDDTQRAIILDHR